MIVCDILLKVPEDLDISDPVFSAAYPEVVWEVQQLETVYSDFIMETISKYILDSLN